ncbi:hypothetical protein [Streptomyces sp. NPDC001492]
MASFNFDESAIKKVVNDGLERMASDLTLALNGITAEYQGKPLEEIKPEVQRVWAAHTGGGELDEQRLTAFAEQIKAGGHVVVRSS